MLVSTLLAVPSQRRSLGHDVVTALGGKVAGWRSEVDLSSPVSMDSGSS